MIVLVLPIIIVENIWRNYNKCSSDSDNGYKRSNSINSNNNVITPSEVVTIIISIIIIIITTNVAVIFIIVEYFVILKYNTVTI